MTQEEILQGHKVILKFMEPDTQITSISLLMDGDPLSWDKLHVVIDHINSLGKEYSFAIFKTYVSLTVEKGGKFYKDFSFAHAEYITSEQTGKEATFKVIVKFIKWQEEKKS